jgi:predicted nucleic acid-binding protein
MRVYLDTCSLQRPLDNKDVGRNALEAEAVLIIIAFCEAGKIEMISSEALLFETRRNTVPARREFAFEMLDKAASFIAFDNQIRDRAEEITNQGVMPLDALHLASAERAEANYFCTCDDKLLKKAPPICAPQMRVVSPIQLLEEFEA